jgi:hypothetical protein
VSGGGKELVSGQGLSGPVVKPQITHLANHVIITSSGPDSVYAILVQYQHMPKKSPAVLIAQEPQCGNGVVIAITQKMTLDVFHHKPKVSEKTEWVRSPDKLFVYTLDGLI